MLAVSSINLQSKFMTKSQNSQSNHSNPNLGIKMHSQPLHDAVAFGNSATTLSKKADTVVARQLQAVSEFFKSLDIKVGKLTPRHGSGTYESFDAENDLSSAEMVKLNDDISEKLIDRVISMSRHTDKASLPQFISEAHDYSLISHENYNKENGIGQGLTVVNGEKGKTIVSLGLAANRFRFYWDNIAEKMQKVLSSEFEKSPKGFKVEHDGKSFNVTKNPGDGNYFIEIKPN